ncbi:MAG: aminotransferase class I/II-fold pyridoxal phosphate-dependent enzyme [Phycisphaerae bacterium]|nr:aminotransferase class I/II-fold pyridoxal phosphate-dependent enzyme [Phycisphaerae bacterium]
MLADRMKLIDASGIRKVFDLAARIKNPINLSIGQPDFDVPDVAKDAAIRAIRDGHNKYTQTQGTGELCRRVADDLKARFGLVDPPVLVTSGVSGGLLLALMATVNPGDEVLIADPYFVMYKHLTRVIGGKPVFIDTYPDFHLTADRIRPHITERTRLLMLNSPCNPSGAVMTQQEIDDILALAAQHDLLVLSDEIYDAFCYDGPHASACGRYDKVLLLKGFSKTYGMTGWRLGYATGPAQVIQAMTMLQQYTFVCAPSMVQAGGLAAMDLGMEEEVAGFAERRDLMYDALKDDFEIVRPSGAFYMFPKAPGGRAEEFVAEAIKNEVLIIPGNVFSERATHFRLCYTVDRDQLLRGAEILCRLARQMR